MGHEEAKSCPHCNQPLKKWRCPEGSSWDAEFLLVCFNDECTYYQRGWDWMKSKYNQSISYRFSLNVVNGSSAPLPVWSNDALKNSIIE